MIDQPSTRLVQLFLIGRKMNSLDGGVDATDVSLLANMFRHRLFDQRREIFDRLLYDFTNSTLVESLGQSIDG